MIDLFNYLDLYLMNHLSAAFIYGADNPPELLKSIAIFCAKYLCLSVPIYCIIMLLNPNFKIIKIGLVPLLIRLSSATILSAVLSYMIGTCFYRVRPFISHPDINLISHSASASFPSNHAMFFAVFLYFIIKYRADIAYSKIGIPIIIVCTVLTCWARVFVGVHYPLDIVGGLILGVFCAFFSDKIFSRFYLGVR